MSEYGIGFGKTYVKEVPLADVAEDRRERIITMVVAGKLVTLVVRADIVPEDPYLNLVRASAYPFQVRSGRARYPVPPVPRTVKAILRTARGQGLGSWTIQYGGHSGGTSPRRRPTP
jgi:hypothetical protein